MNAFSHRIGNIIIRLSRYFCIDFRIQLSNLLQKRENSHISTRALIEYFAAGELTDRALRVEIIKDNPFDTWNALILHSSWNIILWPRNKVSWSGRRMKRHYLLKRGLAFYYRENKPPSSLITTFSWLDRVNYRN